MKPRTLQTCALGAMLVLLAGLGLAVRARMSIHLSDMERTRLAAERAALMGRADQARGSTPTSVVAGGSAPAGQASGAAGANGAGARAEPSKSLAAPSPEEVAEMRLEEARAGVRTVYGPAFVELGFSPERRGEFVARIAAREMQRTALLNEPVRAPEGEAREAELEARRERVAAADAETRAEVAALLGPQGARWVGEQNETMFWALVRELAGQLYASEHPLTAAQARELAMVLTAGAKETPVPPHAQELAAIMTGKAQEPAGPSPGATTAAEVLAARVGKILSASQLEVWKTLREEEELRREINRMNARAVRAKAPNPNLQAPVKPQ